jgi:hypothetical protein
MDRNHADARVMLGEFSRLNGESHEGDEPVSIREAKAIEDHDEEAEEDLDVTHGDEPVSESSRDEAAPGDVPKARRRRGRRGGRGRHKPPAAAAS